MNYTCPVCGYSHLRRPPTDFLICPSCGTEFGYTDSAASHSELRRRWLNNGTMWTSTVIAQPSGWNGHLQLLQAGYVEGLPMFIIKLAIEQNSTATTRESVRTDVRALELSAA